MQKSFSGCLAILIQLWALLAENPDDFRLALLRMTLALPTSQRPAQRRASKFSDLCCQTAFSHTCSHAGRWIWQGISTSPAPVVQCDDPGLVVSTMTAFLRLLQNEISHNFQHAEISTISAWFRFVVERGPCTCDDFALAKRYRTQPEVNSAGKDVQGISALLVRQSNTQQHETIRQSGAFRKKNRHSERTHTHAHTHTHTHPPTHTHTHTHTLCAGKPVGTKRGAQRQRRRKQAKAEHLVTETISSGH